MSKLERLIQQYCPDGVEYVKLDSVANICRGTRVVKSQLSDKGYPVYQNCLTPMGYFERSNCNAGITFVICGGAAGNVGYTDVECWAADDCEFIIGGHQVINRYIYYYLMTKQNYLLSKVRKASIPRLSPSIIKDLEIPLPPLPVQEEIVRILDAFTELQAELQAELQKRKQQYNYYLDNLLNFKNINRGRCQAEVRWMKLKDVCMKTSNIKWKSTTGQYRYIDLSSVDIQTHSIISTIEIDKMSAPSRAQQIVQEDDVIFATTRPTQMRACIIPTQYNGDICSTGYCVLRVDTKILLPRFLFFSLTVSGFKTYLSNNLTLGNYPSISNNTLLEYEVPVPSLANQQRIVAILDRFDTLTTDLTQGLPAEIEKRRQQYEYYRDKLLTFKRKGA